MKRILTVMTVLTAAMMLNGCTKCSQERPVEPPPVVEPPQGEPPAEGATEVPAAEPDVTGAPAQ